MVTKVKKFIGTVRCIGPSCGREIPVTAGGEGGAGALSLSCGFCGLVVYAKPGTRAYRSVSAVIQREEEHEEKPAAARRGAHERPAMQANPAPGPDVPAGPGQNPQMALYVGK